MKHPWIWIIITANLIGLVVLAFVYPSAMVSPGALAPAHAPLANECFSCHAPFRGAASDRCMTCHALADIGVRSTSGGPLEQLNKSAIGTSFHRELSEQDCMSCHGEHGLRTERRFSHGLLPPAALARCESCHAAPTDTFHRQITSACTQCHSPERWKPSTFNHDRFFLLDRDHDSPCATCHSNNDFTRYTCFGCHEHTPANIRAEHEEEGIRDFDDCVSCHRSGEEEGGERGERHERGEED